MWKQFLEGIDYKSAITVLVLGIFAVWWAFESYRSFDNQDDDNKKDSD